MGNLTDLLRLDEKVAEEVMGYAVWPCDVKGEKLGYFNDERFTPTRKISHAWQVVANMTDRGYDVTIKTARNVSGDTVYSVNFGYGATTVEVSTSPAWAICRAALNAMPKYAKIK